MEKNDLQNHLVKEQQTSFNANNKSNQQSLHRMRSKKSPECYRERDLEANSGKAGREHSSSCPWRTMREADEKHRTGAFHTASTSVGPTSAGSTSQTESMWREKCIFTYQSACRDFFPFLFYPKNAAEKTIHIMFTLYL